MAYKQQIYFSLALLAAAVAVASAAGGAAKPKVTAEALLKEMISSTERAKAKVSILGNTRLVQECDKAYASSLDSLNKALGLIGKDSGKFKASINAALHGYDTCDSAYAQSTRPSPFIPNNANLKALGSKILELSAQAKKN